MILRDYTYLVAFGTPYVLMVSFLYLFGFWSIFDINIFEFVEVSDIIMLSIKQLTYHFMFAVFGVVIGYYFPKTELPPGGGAHNPIAISIKKHRRWLILLLILIIFVITQVSDFTYRYFIIGLLVGPILGFLILNMGILSDLIENQRIRLYTVSLIALLPFFSLHLGLTQAHTSINPVSGTNFVVNNDIEETYLYVGHAGQFFFVYDIEEERLVAMNESDVSSFYLEDRNILNGSE